MFQTDQATATSTLPAPAAAGTQGYFTNGNPASGVAATIVDADWLNMIQQELINIVTGAGITPSKTTYNQVLSAIKRIGQSTVVLADTGAVNAYSATNAVPLVAGTWGNGVVQQIAVAHTNNGASTYAPDGLPPIPIYGLGLQPLQQNEMFAGGTAILMKQTIPGVNSGNPICVLLECAGGAQQIPPATASQHAAQLGQVGHGQCRLSVVSSTSLKLAPYNGNNLIINGVPQQIPAAGVTITNSGLAASTVYYVYAYMNAGVMALELSTTGYTTASNGIVQKIADATRTLVGMIFSNASSQFVVDSATQRLCLNHFNRRALSLNILGTVGNFTNTAAAELDTSKRLECLSWNDEGTFASVNGQAINTTAGNNVIAFVAIDGAQYGAQSGGTVPSNSYQVGFSSSASQTINEGHHLVQLYGLVGGGTGSMPGVGVSATIRG